MTLKPLLNKEPEDHWLLAVIANAYYEKKQYETAYKYITDAVLIEPKCPLVLWNLASIFRMVGKQGDAIIVWGEIIKKGAKAIAYDKCGEGIARARSLVNDSKYMISKTYKELGNSVLAEGFKQAYLKNLSKGVQSNYDPATL